jgi:hypothetical protein
VARSASIPELKDRLREVHRSENLANFLGAGALTEAWPDLAEITILDKRRKGYGGKQSEERTGRLKAMLTEGGDGFTETVGPDSVTWAYDSPALVQHAGAPSRNHPPRDLLPVRPERYAEVWVRHAAEVAAAEGLAP